MAEMFFSILWMVILPIVIGLIANYFLVRYQYDLPKVEKVFSIVAMIAICIICAIVVANAHDALKSVGIVLVIVVALHNLIGYTLGYWGASCRD